MLAAHQLIKGRNPRLILLASDGVGIVVSFQSSSSFRAVLLLRILELLDLLLESGYPLFALFVLLGTRPVFLQGRRQPAHVLFQRRALVAVIRLAHLDDRVAVPRADAEVLVEPLAADLVARNLGLRGA